MRHPVKEFGGIAPHAHWAADEPDHIRKLWEACDGQPKCNQHTAPVNLIIAMSFDLRPVELFVRGATLGAIGRAGAEFGLSPVNASNRASGFEHNHLIAPTRNSGHHWGL